MSGIYNSLPPVDLSKLPKDPPLPRGPYDEFDPNYNFAIHLKELERDILLGTRMPPPIYCPYLPNENLR